MIKLFNIDMKKCILLLPLFNFSMLYAQSISKEPPAKYYQGLIAELSNADTVFVYEKYSDLGNSITYFISRKNNKSVYGYWINQKYSWNVLMPRGILPKDSLSGINRIIIDTSIKGSEIAELIYKNKIFELRDESQIKEKCGNDVYDGAHYQLTLLTNKVGISKSYYEIYEENCASIKEYNVFISLDKLFLKHFTRSETIRKELIEEYKKREQQ